MSPFNGAIGNAVGNAPFNVVPVLGGVAAGQSVIVMACSPGGTAMTILDTLGNTFVPIYSGAGPQGQKYQAWLIASCNATGADTITISGGTDAINLFGTVHSVGVVYRRPALAYTLPSIVGTLTNYPAVTLNCDITLTAPDNAEFYLLGYADGIQTGMPFQYFSQIQIPPTKYAFGGMQSLALATYSNFFSGAGGVGLAPDSWIFALALPLPASSAGGAGFGAGVNSAGGDLLFF